MLIVCLDVAAQDIDPPAGDSLLTPIDSSGFTTSNIGDSNEFDFISPDAIEELINYKAIDSIITDFGANTITLYDSAEVVYDNIQLKAAIIVFDWKNNIVIATGVYDSNGNYIGTPEFFDHGKSYKAKKIVYNFKSKKGKLYELFTKEGEGYVHGEEVKKDEEGNLLVHSAKYSTCDLEHPHFYIAASKLKIMDKQIISGPAWIVVEDVPLPLVVPFGFFPKKQERSSGILLPSPGEEVRRGFFLKGFGYYFGINDYVDLTIKGDIFSRGSWGISTNTNYNVRYKYNGNLSLQYANNRLGDPDASDFSLSKDFIINWSHNQDSKARPNSTFKASVNAGSQNSYRNNATTADQILQNTLRSSIAYSMRFAGTPFSLNTSLSHSQNLSQNTINLTAPDMSFNMNRITPFKPKKGVIKKRWYNDIGFRYSMNFRNSINTTDTMFLMPETWRDWEYGMQHNIPLSTSFKLLKYFTVSPNVNYKGITYFHSIENNYFENYNQTERDTVIETINEGVFHANDVNFSASISTRIYGMFNINKFGLIAIRHLITPNISFTYRPDFGDPKFGYYKTVQLDSTGKTGTYSVIKYPVFGRPSNGKSGGISFGIQNNLEAKVKSKADTVNTTRKIKLIDNFNINGYYNFLADSMRLSTIRMNGRTTLFKNKLSIQFSGELNPYLIDQEGFVINKYELVENKRLGRLTRANLTISSRMKSRSKKPGKAAPEEQIGFDAMPFDQYVDFDIPWDLAVNYTLSYTKLGLEPTTTQTLNFNGGLSLTSKWKITFNSGYDLEKKEFTFTSLNMHRDLHCWEMSFNWIPFGYRQSYMFTLKVKSAVLKDLKINKEKSFRDNY
ncbi:putative LPS assembly protein LptD [Bacteroidota bacterium]